MSDVEQKTGMRIGAASPVERYRFDAVKAVLAQREKEILDIKGPCSNCRLHLAHSGPCDIRRSE